tara:strand:+ start:3928 stop:4665 length:738 start_codon:yes stop_codon:yes gene_type:complete
MATLDSWNFFNNNVQSGLLEGRYMNAAFTLIAAGPPRMSAFMSSLDDFDTAIAYPVGVVQSLNIGQNSQVMRLWEIGSERSYFVRGRTMGQMGMGRILYHGPSLLRVLYAYLDDPNGKFNSLYTNTQQTDLNTSGNGDTKKKYGNLPGYKNLWLDLASDVFSQPIGLLLQMKDSNENTVGAFYLEYCMITNHGFATDAGGTIMTENAAIMYERMRPVDVDAVALVKNSTSLTSSGMVSKAIGSAS